MTVLRVRFAETDQMGVAHHAAYVVWLEAARVEWMRERGLSYRALEDEGVSMAVASLEVTYRAAARFDDELTIHTRLAALKSRFGRFRYLVEGPNGDIVAHATSDHIATNREGRAIRLPRAWHDTLAMHLETDAGNEHQRTTP